MLQINTNSRYQSQSSNVKLRSPLFRIKKLASTTNDFNRTANSSNGFSTIPLPNIRLSLVNQQLSKIRSSLILNEEDFQQKQNKDEIRSLLNVSNEEVMEDQRPTPQVGEEAINKFYRNHKILERISEQNNLKQIQESLYTAMHRKAQSCRALPCKVGIIKYQGREDTVSLSHMKYGDSYIEVLQEGVQKNKQVQCFNFTDNRITSKGSGPMLQALQNVAPRELVLKQNRIGAVGVENVIGILYARVCRIELLDLEDNNLGSKLIIELCKGLSTNRTVRVLNLSCNCITSIAGPALSQLVQENTSLQELYLHWNQLSYKEIFNALKSNENLKVLDLSYNIFGAGDAHTTQAIADALTQNTELVHLDLSFNKFTERSAKILSESLAKNTTIQGFHFEGNRGYVDESGFLVAGEGKQTNQLGHRIQGCTFQPKQRSNFKLLRDVCWICEGWVQVEYVWDTPTVEDVLLHASWVDFRGIPMQKKSDGTYRMYYMVNRLLFCKQKKRFPQERQLSSSVLGHQSGLLRTIQSRGLAHKQIPLQCPIQNQNRDKYSLKINPKAQFYRQNVDIMGKKHKIQMYELNYMNLKINHNIVDQFYNPTIDIVPRKVESSIIPTNVHTNYWQISGSIFKDWVRDNEEILDELFEEDWNGSSIMIIDQQDRVSCKRFLREQYKSLRETFKKYSSIQDNQLCVTADKLTTIVRKMDIIEAQTHFRNSIIMDDLNDTKRHTKKTLFLERDYRTLLGDQQYFTSSQFLEVWVRITEVKFINGLGASSYLEGLTLLWSEHIKPECEAQAWRDTHYWNAHCDQIYKEHSLVMMHIYENNSQRPVAHDKLMMNLQGFSKIIKQILEATDEQIQNSWCLSLMSKLHRTKRGRNVEATYIEVFITLFQTHSLTPKFLEAFARVAHLDKSRVIQLETLVIEAFNTLCSSEFKDSYSNIFNGE